MWEIKNEVYTRTAGSVDFRNSRTAAAMPPASRKLSRRGPGVIVAAERILIATPTGSSARTLLVLPCSSAMEKTALPRAGAGCHTRYAKLCQFWPCPPQYLMGHHAPGSSATHNPLHHAQSGWTYRLHAFLFHLLRLLWLNTYTDPLLEQPEAPD
jgi:hypothetical protein